MLSLKESNDVIIDLIKNEKPFSVTRLGNAISLLSINYDKNKNNNIDKLSNVLNLATNWDGIYYDSLEMVNAYAIKYNKALENSDRLATFPELCKPQHDYYIEKYNLNTVHNRVLEPFYICLEDNIPWTHFLLNKKVLIIHPFIESFKKQIENNFSIFSDKSIFLEGQEFIFYKPFQSLAGLRPHNNWLETFQIMCNDISKLDFDIALLGCGGYGVPLCDFIKSKLNKSAIYVGGGLQLLFGVMGQRWENNELWKKIISENNCTFIKPSGNEIIKHKEIVEGGCYW
tara:strand:- start:432 stop:1289 length:858 start_codon:yes stop_codon:yes gene_type:complete